MPHRHVKKSENNIFTLQVWAAHKLEPLAAPKIQSQHEVNMKEVIIDTYCGLSCRECEYKQKCNCEGCKNTKGHPFHGQCELAQ